MNKQLLERRISSLTFVAILYVGIAFGGLIGRIILLNEYRLAEPNLSIPRSVTGPLTTICALACLVVISFVFKLVKSKWRVRELLTVRESLNASFMMSCFTITFGLGVINFTLLITN